MKKEATKKSKKWLWLTIGLAALIAIAGVVLALVLGGEKEDGGPVGGRPDLYWNIDKAVYTADSQSGLSTREPGEDGIYRIRFAYNGEQLELPIADKQLVNFIDTMDVMGLVQDADGTVVDVVAPEDFVTPVAQNAYVQQVMSDKIIANSSIAMNGMQYTIELCELTEIYNVSTSAQVAGEIIEASAFLPMDSIWVFANDLEENTHIYMTDHPVESAVYWRAYQMWNSKEKATSRVPDENGVYSVDFCCNGEIVTLKCKDKSIVTSIDNKSPHSCHFGFVFDEEGYIVDIMNSGIGIRGAVAAERIEITELDGAYFSGTQLIPSDGGLSYSATLPENCVIYDASSAAMREGRQGQQVESLQLGDRACVWTDPTGTPVLVYLANRLVDAPAYYNVVRKYDGTLKETTREPVGGYYEFEVVETGKVGKITVKTSDKELASFIDSLANRLVGLKLEGNIIKYAYESDDVFGWSPIYGGYVTQIQGSIVSVVSFAKPDAPTNILLDPTIKFYDVSGKDVPYGTETTLRVGDIVTFARNVSNNGVVGYVTRSMVGGDCVYYNLDYQYNSTTKETKRIPDENGWYYFTMAHNGKVVEVKTRNKEFANLIDKSPNGDLVVVMRVVNGVVQEVYETAAAYGQVLRSGWRISAVNGDGTYTVINAKGVEQVIKMADDCVIYNVSPVYDNFKGERIYSLKVGDMVTTLADYRSEAKLIYVRQRVVDKMYVNAKRLYDATNKVTLREPDAEGWYWFDLAVDGQLKRFKTQDKAIASIVDSYTTPFGLRVKDDVILNVVSPTYVKGVYKAGINGWDVTSVSGSTVKIKLNKPGYTDTGKTRTLSVGSRVKVYDISPTAESFGAAVKLQKGDRVRTYLDREDNCVYVFVLFHETRVKGSVGYCDHCQKEVYWNPWAGDSWDGVDCHYYLAGDVTITKQTSVGNATKEYEVVLDLNGKKLTVNGARAFLAFRGDDLSILDSVGGGEVAATGTEGGNGGTLLISGESTVNLYSGTLSFTDSDIHVYRGAVVYLSTGCTFNMYGGTVKGGIVNSPTKNVQGGNLYLDGGTFNMYGGVVEDGRAERTDGLEPAVAAQGGNIYGLHNGVLNLYGGVIRNGYSNQHGGNIFLSTCTLNMSGGEITGGECRYSGGNMYSQFASVFNISGGKVEKGTAGAAGNNLYVVHDTSELNISGGSITGDLMIAKAKSVTVSGAPKITVGEKSGLSLPSAVKLTLGELTKGAEIYVNAKGVFSEPSKDAQAYVDAGYIKPGAPRSAITVQNNALAMEGEKAYCEHCSEMVSWYEWPGTSSPESGHYFVAKDTVQKSQLTIAADTDVVLDLYGKTYSSEKIRNFLVRGTLSIMDSVGTGVMVSTGGEEFAGSIALVGTAEGSQKPAGFNLYSGTLKLAEDHPIFANGGVIAFGGGELNIYGGTIQGGYVSNYGGCITVSSTGSVMNMYGGLITGGTSKAGGGCVNVLGTLNMEGGTIDGGVYMEPKSKGINLSGDAVIGELNLAAGIKAEVSGLTDGAKVSVLANGVFTKKLENPASYLKYFEAVDETKDIRATSDALEIAMGAEQIAKYNTVYDAAVKMSADGVFASGGVVEAECPYCEKTVTWEPLEAIDGSTNKKLTGDKHYYLSGNVDNSAIYLVYGKSCLHLNGYNITSTTRAIYVEQKYHLNIMGDGAVVGTANKHSSLGWWGALDVPGSVNLFGGIYSSFNYGPAIAVRGSDAASVVNMYNGTTVMRDTGIGIRVYDDGDFNMYGGNVSGAVNNFVLESGSNSSRSVSLAIYDGAVENGTATLGGNIYASGQTTSVSIYGGSVVGGSVYLAGDVKGILLSGAPVISELNLNSGIAATLFELTDGTSIGVLADGPFTVKNEDAETYAQKNYFAPIRSDSSIRHEDGVLFVDVQKIYCPHCEQDVRWDVWPGANSPVSGHYYIAEDFTAQSGQWSIVAGTDVVLDLRGNTYSTDGIRNFLVRGTLSVVDTAGGGEMVVTGNAATHGGIAMVSTANGSEKPACFNLYSGTLRLADNHAAVEYGSVLQVTSGAVLNMYGGTICGGSATVAGGNVNIGSANVTFNMYGGEILGGTAPAGGSVNLVGTMNMSGGTIDGEVYVSGTANVTLSNDVTIGNLNIAEGKKVELGGLTTGAQIGVTASGVFTNALTNADTYLDYFVKLKPVDLYQVEGDAIAMNQLPYAEYYNVVHTAAEKMTADGVFDNGGTVEAECPVCGGVQQWQELNALGSMKVQTAGHYYLSDDVNNTTFYNFMAGACLHLNGKNITSSARALYFEPKNTSNGSLNIMGKGTISGAGETHTTTPRGGALDLTATVNLFGGTYVHTNEYPVITMRAATANELNIFDGVEIRGDDSITGSSLRIRCGNVNIYGGLITGGNATNGGNIIVDGGANNSLNVYGGTIQNGKAGLGGNIYAAGAKATVNIAGGTITGGDVYIAGDVKAAQLSGKPVVSELDLTSGKKLTLGQMETGAEVFVTADGIIAEGVTDAADYLNYIKALDPDYAVEADGSVLKVRWLWMDQMNDMHNKAEKMTTDGVFSAGGTIPATCPHCGTDANWEPLPAISGTSNMKLTENKHYYLAGSLSNKSFYYIQADICLHLNGNNITSSSRAFYVEDTLTIMGKGIVTGNSNAAGNGAMDVVGVANLFGGTYMAGNAYNIVSVRSNVPGNVLNMYEGAEIVRNESVAGPAVRVYDYATFNMYGGLVSGGTRAGGKGGNFQVASSSVNTHYVALNIYGGVVENGSADKGGNIYAEGKTCSVSICGGTITNGNIYVWRDLETLSVSGKPSVSELDLTSGMKLTLGELKQDAQIWVTAPNGAFTNTSDAAASYVEFFKTAAQGKTVKADGNALVIADA